jgi:hypothetical protein
MNEQEAAAWEVHQFVQSLGLPYAVIGGMAVQWWGEPRMTKDVDLTVVAPLDQPSSVFIQQVLDRFPARKAIAGRPQDVRDIEGILYRQRDALDVAIIRPWLHAFAELLDNPEIVERFERPWLRNHSSGSPS